MVKMPTNEERLHYIQRKLVQEEARRIDSRSWWLLQGAIILGANVPFFAKSHDWHGCVVFTLCCVILLIARRSDKKARKMISEELVAMSKVDPHFHDLKPMSVPPQSFNERLE